MNGNMNWVGFHYGTHIIKIYGVVKSIVYMNIGHIRLEEDKKRNILLKLNLKIYEEYNMGMYTDLVCKAIIKDEYRDKMYKRMYEDFEWKDLFDHYFVENESANHIPYMNTIGLKPENIFNGINLVIDCEVINYFDVCDDFFDFLQEISEEIIEFKTHYEEAYDWNDDYTERSNYWKNYLTNGYETIIYKVNGDDK